MKIKFCGVKRPEDIQIMNDLRPDYVGFVFAGVKRRLTPKQAAGLAEKLSGGIKKVGVFVNEPAESLVKAARLCGLDAVQLHGDETAADIPALKALLPGIEIWKAVRVKDAETVRRAASLPADRILLDSFSAAAYGGTGEEADIAAIQSAKLDRPFFLAGGLNAGNLAKIICQLHPYGVDISSGIETDGVKDRAKAETLMEILRRK